MQAQPTAKQRSPDEVAAHKRQGSLLVPGQCQASARYGYEYPYVGHGGLAGPLYETRDSGDFGRAQSPHDHGRSSWRAAPHRIGGRTGGRVDGTGRDGDGLAGGPGSSDVAMRLGREETRTKGALAARAGG